MENFELNLRWLAIFQIAVMILLIFASKGSKTARSVYLLFSTLVLLFLLAPFFVDYGYPIWSIEIIMNTVIFLPLLMLRIAILTVSDSSETPLWYWFLIFSSATLCVFCFLFDSDPIGLIFRLFFLSLQLFILTISTTLVYRLLLESRVNEALKYRYYFNLSLLYTSFYIYFLQVDWLYDAGFANKTLVIIHLISTILILLFFSVRLLLVQEVNYQTQLWFDKNIRFNDFFVNVASKDDSVRVNSNKHSEAFSNDSEANDFFEKVKRLKLYTDVDLRVDHVAEKCGISKSKCRSIVTDSLGYKNFNQFINNLRIEHAKKQIIEEPERPFSSIAIDVGFKSISAFNNAFKKSTKVTPTHYRASRISNRVQINSKENLASYSREMG